jgi:hypothetical protein
MNGIVAVSSFSRSRAKGAEAIKLRHVHIADDEVGKIPLGEINPRLAIFGGNGRESEHAQCLLNDHADLSRVIYD